MELLKGLFKFLLAVILIVGGTLIGGTIFASKKIDDLGDKLQDKIHGN
ncbi:hypothetical protein [Liquorilactobacillus cacaonum]|nr:hypothetical protein [Liquorilactobacillus cacaonum]